VTFWSLTRRVVHLAVCAMAVLAPFAPMRRDSMRPASMAEAASQEAAVGNGPQAAMSR
jgi:hypothetical protein